MSTIASCPELHPPRVDAGPGRANDLRRDDPATLGASLKQLRTMHVVAPCAAEPLPSKERTADPARGLPARIQKLIELHGGAAVIAGRCGFSEGAVRNWRDGRSDISRERCITMAHTLGVSLLWLVAGEGSMQAGTENPAPPDAIPVAPSRPEQCASDPRYTSTLDSRLLATSLRLLQSYIGLIGGSLDPNSRADRLAELYDISSRVGDVTLISRLINFHSTLGEQLRRNRALIA
jgi:hypothetical protein